MLFIGMLCIFCRADATVREFHLTDYLRHDWRDEVVHFPVDFQRGECDGAHYRLTRTGDAQPVPAQLIEVTRYPDGSVRQARLVFRCDLPAGQTRGWRLDTGATAPAQPCRRSRVRGTAWCSPPARSPCWCRWGASLSHPDRRRGGAGAVAGGEGSGWGMARARAAGVGGARHQLPGGGHRKRPGAARLPHRVSLHRRQILPGDPPSLSRPQLRPGERGGECRSRSRFVFSAYAGFAPTHYVAPGQDAQPLTYRKDRRLLRFFFNTYFHQIYDFKDWVAFFRDDPPARIIWPS